MHPLKQSLLASTIVASLSFSALATDTTVNQADTWRKQDIFESLQLWQTAKDAIESELDQIEKCQGKLGDSAQTLAGCLETLFDLKRRWFEVRVYAGMSADTDMRNDQANGRRQAAILLRSKLDQTASFISPELLNIGESKLNRFIAQQPRLKPFRQYIKNTLRQSPHTLGNEGENILAAAGKVTKGANSAYATFINADLPWQSLTIEGEAVKITQSAFAKYRGNDDRKVRKQVFDSFFGSLDKYKRTIGSLLNTSVNSAVFNAQARKYQSSLTSALSGADIPQYVYRALVKTTNENLPTFHRYLKLRGRLLAIDDLQYYDIYPPLVTGNKHFSLEKGKQLALQSTRLLGEEYSAVLQKGFNERWMDAYPSEGKQAGAYMNGGAYSIHPFILMNYNDDYSSVSTLTHEWGHALHSYLSSKNQPYPTANYPVFVAEVASTFNEALLLDHMLKNSSSDKEKLYYLGTALEDIRATFIRQTLFAEFELDIHEAVQRGEPLTGDSLTQAYLALVRRYHGHHQGIMNIDPLYGVEWAYVRQFYYNFYVYQYATSMAAASLLANDVMSKKPGALNKYLGLLKAGGSDNAYQLLKKSGVDMATTAPYEATFKRMNYLMDEIETILNRTSGKKGE